NNNNASDASAYGILIDGISGLCHSNIIVENLISSNFESGILLRGYSVSNQILSNTIDSNSEGIDIWPFASNNIIQSNMIRDNTNFGISIESDNNTIYQNCFVDNALDALDDGIGNNWDYGMSGNYWDNYTGSDDNKDGIGDVPYDIGGIAVSRDNYPLMSCPFIITPGGIPGYNLILLVIIGTGMIICTICLMLRKNGYWNNGTINSV
ncbi:MAG: NosD domain-containing protein, partial [Candidatus Thorarchaeota archaeon]